MLQIRQKTANFHNVTVHLASSPIGKKQIHVSQDSLVFMKNLTHRKSSSFILWADLETACCSLDNVYDTPHLELKQYFTNY